MQSQIKDVTNKPANKSRPGIVSLSSWVEAVGVQPITAWRWRKRGWIETINIAGRQYITTDAIDKFTARAAAGEFYKEHKTPARRMSEAERN